MYGFVVCFFLVTSISCGSLEEEKYGVKFADECEVCKVFTVEFTSRLDESAKKHEVVETGYSHMKEKKKTKYVKSELRLIETLDGICDRILEYNIHKEREDSTRFAKGQSETFRTLEGLVDKGVKVDIGIPKELWNKPSAEITQLKTQCESLMENYEEDIEEWYFNQQDVNFSEYLCRNRVLKNKDSTCLSDNSNKSDKKKKKAKSKKKEKSQTDSKVKGETGKHTEL